MEDKTETCLSSLFLTDPKDDREKLIQEKGSRVNGTCEWIKSNKLYNWWLQSPSQLLWLSGGPSKGKTMLSIFLAEELERAAKYSQGALFLQYFCDYRDEKRKTAITVLRGLIFQLLQSRQKLFHHILSSFNIQKESLFTGSSFDSLWRIFESMICDPILGTTYCVLDALDECDENSSELLLRKFNGLFPAKTGESVACHLELIIVSRDLDSAPEFLSNFPRIDLDLDADIQVHDDIRQFIEEKVNDLSKHRRYPEPLRVHVKKVLQDRAQGTFLWVGIVTKDLKRCKVSEVENALDDFPPGLDKVYGRILLQIDIGRREIAARILRWVVIAARPLTLSELSVVTETTVGSSVISSRDEIIRDQVSYCRYFLMIQGDKVGLIHQSAKDYLLRKTCDSNPKLEFFRIKEEVASLEIARRCFNYLQSGALAAGRVDLWKVTSHSRAFPLLEYAVLHWFEHTRSLARSEDIFDLSHPFYHMKSQIRESWLKTYHTRDFYADLVPDPHPLLHMASHFGILPLAENILLENSVVGKVNRLFYMNKPDGRGKTALIWAAGNGHEAIVRLLLNKAADVDVQDEFGETALFKAALNGHENTVGLLLEKGADIDIKNKHGVTALLIAARFGYENIVQHF